MPADDRPRAGCALAGPSHGPVITSFVRLPDALDDPAEGAPVWARGFYIALTRAIYCRELRFLVEQVFEAMGANLPKSDDEATAEFGKLLDRVVLDSTTRQEFAAEPDRALEKAGVNQDVIPDDALGLLKGLSNEELEFLARVGNTFSQAGLTAELPGGGHVALL